MRGWLLTIGAAIPLLWASTAPALTCFDVCVTTCRNEIERRVLSPECQFQVASCSADCGGSAGEKGRHGALAYSRSTGAVGWSYDYPFVEAATGRAIGECRRRASDCGVVVTFHGGCAAAAAAPGGPVTWGKSATAQGAAEAAVRHCDRQATGCAVKVWACSWR